DIDADVVAEGVRVLSAAREQDVPLRLLGGVAVRLRARNGLPAALQRTYGDLDFVTERRASGPAQKLFRELGYEPHVSFNALNSKERLLFFDHEHDRQVDVSSAPSACATRFRSKAASRWTRRRFRLPSCS